MTAHVLRNTRSLWSIVLTLAFALAGFLAVTQIRNELLIRQQLRLPSQELSELGYTLREQERIRSTFEQQIVSLREQVRARERTAALETAQLATLGRDLEQLRIHAGVTALGGPGLVVELRDSPQPLSPGGDPNTVILHYTDLQSVINELWASGAEAISLNGIRIISFTSLNCVGTTVLCSTKRLAPPYQIVAIGNPGTMETYLRRSGGAVETLRAFGFPVKVRADSRVRVPPYRGSFQFTNTQVVP